MSCGFLSSKSRAAFFLFSPSASCYVFKGWLHDFSLVKNSYGYCESSCLAAQVFLVKGSTGCADSLVIKMNGCTDDVLKKKNQHWAVPLR
ncbi:hypothetical protein Droror1_Dr00008584 [Drosera rotundifolia]